MKVNNSRKKAPFPIGQYLVGLFILLTACAFSFLLLLQFSMQPAQEDREQAEKTARQYTDLQAVESFSIYNGRESYYSLIGTNAQGVREAVLIARDAGQIRVYQLDQGISQLDAEELVRDSGAESIDRVTFGYLDGQPVWEIKSGSRYYNVGFESRELI